MADQEAQPLATALLPTAAAAAQETTDVSLTDQAPTERSPLQPSADTSAETDFEAFGPEDRAEVSQEQKDSSKGETDDEAKDDKVTADNVLEAEARDGDKSGPLSTATLSPVTSEKVKERALPSAAQPNAKAFDTGSKPSAAAPVPMAAVEETQPTDEDLTEAEEPERDRASFNEKPSLPSKISLATETLAGPTTSQADRGQDPTLSAPSPLTASVSPSLVSAAAPIAADSIILGIAVVDFNHLVGPQVEYAHPTELLNDKDLVKSLPFLALPDGSHLSDEDFCYFHLHCPQLSDSTIFGISCNRQIASDALLKKGAEVTRSTVQKAVVVLAKEPVFGPIREKLGIVTRAFFAQGDLGDVDILVEFHATLDVGLRSGGLADDRETVMYMGTSIRELVHKWHFKTLMLVKLLLLQRRIMFFGYPVESLCTYQYSLVSLIPGLLLSLQDAADPAAKSRESRGGQAESLRTSDRKSLMKYLGMPLNIFGESSFFQPYCPLQQIDLLQARSWLVGTSNSIFKQQKDCKIDVVVDLETSTLEFQDPRLQSVVGLTPADRKWMDEIVHVVNETWNPADPTRPTSMGYHGSDDFLRAKFEDYICALLSSTRYADFLAKSDPDSISITAPDASSSHHFGPDYLAALRTTNAFAIWQATTDPMLFDIVDHKHPCEGKTSAIEDVGLRLSAGLHDLRLEENLGPTREAIGSAIQAGGANIYRLASNFRTDFAKFRAGQLSSGVGMLSSGGTSTSTNVASPPPSASQEGVDVATPLPSPGAARGTITGEAIDATGRRTGRSSSLRPLSLVGSTSLSTTGGAVPTTPTNSSAMPGFQANANEAMAVAGQAAAQAGTQVRAALGSFGSFLSSRQKAWSTARSPSPAATTMAQKSPETPGKP